MIGGMGTPELLLILGIVVIVFGARRIPEIGRSVGKGLREFKKARRDIADDLEDELGTGPDPDEKQA